MRKLRLADIAIFRAVLKDGRTLNLKDDADRKIFGLCGANDIALIEYGVDHDGDNQEAYVALERELGVG